MSNQLVTTFVSVNSCKCFIFTIWACLSRLIGCFRILEYDKQWTSTFFAFFFNIWSGNCWCDFCCSFDIFKPMHEMWKSYMTQLLKNVGWDSFSYWLFQYGKHASLLCLVMHFLSHSMFMTMKAYLGFILQEKSVGTMSSHCRSTWCYDFRLEPEVIFFSAAMVLHKKKFKCFWELKKFSTFILCSKE